MDFSDEEKPDVRSKIKPQPAPERSPRKKRKTQGIHTPTGDEEVSLRASRVEEVSDSDDYDPSVFFDDDKKKKKKKKDKKRKSEKKKKVKEPSSSGTDEEPPPNRGSKSKEKWDVVATVQVSSNDQTEVTNYERARELIISKLLQIPAELIDEERQQNFMNEKRVVKVKITEETKGKVDNLKQMY